MKNKPDNLGFELNFTGVGFPKCGTTFLSEVLRKHPEIDMSKHKETNFFMTDKQGLRDYIGPKTWEDYKKEFDLTTKKIHGEFSVYYIYDENALRGIKNCFPRIKAILSLRNPVDFLYSSYWYIKNSNAKNDIPNTFEEAVFSKNLKHPCGIEHGKFSNYIQNCFSIFGKENVLVVFLEDIKKNPEEVKHQVYSFVGVDPSYDISLEEEKINVGKSSRYPFLLPLVRVFIKLLRIIGLNGILHDWINGTSAVRRFYQQIMFKQENYPPMSKNTRRLIITKLLDDISNVEDLVGRDLSIWKTW